LSTTTRAGVSLHVVVVANGEYLDPAGLLPVVERANVLIAADGGANWLAAQGRVPDVLIGDMDSVTPEVLRALEDGRCRLVRRPSDKDETDTELALLEAVALGAGRITILGALGGRADHALANILLLTMPQLMGIETVIDDGHSHLALVRDDGTIRGEEGDIVSLLPIGGDVEGIVTEGLKYPLRGETLHLGPARGVSNVLLGPVARVTLRKGLLLTVHTPKGNRAIQA
jgi:thiamine pyrophosphokinase